MTLITQKYLTVVMGGNGNPEPTAHHPTASKPSTNGKARGKIAASRINQRRMTNQKQNQSPEPESETQETYHAVTERWRCYKMQEKYGWRLKRIEKKQSSFFKYDCVFEGDAQFPDYMED